MKLVYQYMVIFFNFSPSLNHLLPSQIENCDSNSRIVMDEDDNGKIRLERVKFVMIFHSNTCDVLVDKLFPGLDILRLCVRFAAPTSHYFSPSSPDTLNFLLRCLSPDSSAPNKMLALRTIVNCFQNSAGESAVLSHHDALMAHLLNLKTTNPNANIQIAFTSVLLNLSVLYRKNDNEDGRVACLSAIAELRSEVTDSEAQFRSLVCLGNILSGSSVCQEFAKSLGLLEFLTQFASVQDSQKVQSCASFIVGILRWN